MLLILSKMFALIMFILLMLVATLFIAEMVMDEVEDEMMRQHYSSTIIKESNHPFLNKIAKYYISKRKK